MEGYNDSYKVEAGVKPMPEESNLNKLAFDSNEADKTKRRRGAILAALLQMGITATSLEAMGAPVQNPENIAEQVLKEEQKAEKETEKSSITILTPTEEMRKPIGEKMIGAYEKESGKMVVEGPDGTIIVIPPKNITAEQKETLKHQMDEMARKIIEQNHQQ